MLKHLAVFHSRVLAHNPHGLLFARFEIRDRLHIGTHIPPDRLRLLFDELSRGVDPVQKSALKL
jgi:hypothetical protein